MLPLQFLGRRSVCHPFHDEFDNFGIGLVNPRHPAFIAANMRDGFHGQHASRLPGLRPDATWSSERGFPNFDERIGDLKMDRGSKLGSIVVRRGAVRHPGEWS